MQDYYILYLDSDTTMQKAALMNGTWGESFYHHTYDTVSTRIINWIWCHYLKNKDKIPLHAYMVTCYKVKKKAHKNTLSLHIMLLFKYCLTSLDKMAVWYVLQFTEFNFITLNQIHDWLNLTKFLFLLLFFSSCPFDEICKLKPLC